MLSHIKKTLLAVFIVGFIFSFAGCDGFGEEDTTIDIVIKDQEFRFTFKPDTVSASQFRAGVRSVATINFADLITENNITTENIVTATPLTVKLEISFPIAAEVDIFSKLEFGFINGDLEVPVGSLESFPQGTDEVNLIANRTRDITTYMAGENIGAYLSIETVESLDNTVEYDFTITVSVQVQAELTSN